jgi:hypothetical protein
MWELTVSNVHTFAVGAGEYVVHNCSKHINDPFDEPRPQKAGKPKDDRLRGGDAKKTQDRRQLTKAAKHLGMKREERYGFGDYIEEQKQGMSGSNDYNFSWKDLLRHGRDYLRKIRGED